MTKRTKSSRLSRIGSAFATVIAAVDVAKAVQNRRMPPAGALDALGIDEDAFRRMQRR